MSPVSTICAAVVLSGGLVAPPAGAQIPPNCAAKLLVNLTPDVPDPRAQSFLDSLAADPVFKLYWVRSTETSVVLELVGPGPDYRCREEIRRIRKDGRVERLQVLSAHGTSPSAP